MTLEIDIKGRFPKCKHTKDIQCDIERKIKDILEPMPRDQIKIKFINKLD